jgi:hypothetical protein
MGRGLRGGACKIHMYKRIKVAKVKQEDIAPKIIMLCAPNLPFHTVILLCEEYDRADGHHLYEQPFCMSVPHASAGRWVCLLAKQQYVSAS